MADELLAPGLKKRGDTGFDGNINFYSKHNEVILTINSNEQIIKHRIDFPGLVEEFGNASQVFFLIITDLGEGYLFEIVSICARINLRKQIHAKDLQSIPL